MLTKRLPFGIFFEMSKNGSKKSRVDISPESRLAVRISVLEAQNEVILDYLKELISLFQGEKVLVDGPSYEDAMRELLRGNRVPIEEYHKRGGFIPALSCVDKHN